MNKLAPPPNRTAISPSGGPIYPWQTWFSDLFNFVVALQSLDNQEWSGVLSHGEPDEPPSGKFIVYIDLDDPVPYEKMKVKYHSGEGPATPRYIPLSF
jgi:hypothetical protein